MPLANPGGAVAQARRPPLAPYPRHPDPVELLKVLQGLLDRTVTVTSRSNAPREAPEESTFRALYAGADGSMAVCVSVEVPLGAACGAALAMVPAAQVEGWLESGELPEDASANLREVLNVLSAPFNDVNPLRHIRITEMLGPGEASPPELVEMVGRARKHEVLDVTVEDYPGGPLRIVST